ncbi:hypothetical protein CCACVL1_29079 [Corchorus capsularis]|uniref:Uncharacterized protein n=1 Tax=Corchorus capsularis TaxID=210143 RepID=A0A1R3G3Y8_COCAP|nr:hypothetical protein CCACVL1_29079 [Corchorus capsularis]
MTEDPSASTATSDCKSNALHFFPFNLGKSTCDFTAEPCRISIQDCLIQFPFSIFESGYCQILEAYLSLQRDQRGAACADVDTEEDRSRGSRGGGGDSCGHFEENRGGDAVGIEKLQDKAEATPR